MAVKRSAKKREEKTRDYLTVDSFEILNAREVDFSGRDVVFFTLIINGVKIYDCRIAKSGAGNEFISFPQRKGKDENYYPVAYASLSDKDSDEIITAVYDAL